MILNWVTLLFWIVMIYSSLWSVDYVEKHFTESPYRLLLRVAALLTGPIIPLLHRFRKSFLSFPGRINQLFGDKLHPNSFCGIRFFDMQGLPLPQPGADACLLIQNLVQEVSQFHAHELFIDLHNDGYWVRLRKKGGSRDLPPLHKKLGEPLVAAIKMLANIEEGSAISDGAFTVQKDRLLLTWVVNVTAAANGEKLSILSVEPCPGTQGLQMLSQLGMGELPERRIKKMLKHQNGLVLLVIPHHHGGTTTAYAMMREVLLLSGRNSAAIEESAKFEAPEITQIENADPGTVSPAELVRNALNLDAGALAVLHAEDPETIAAAIEAAEERLVLLRLTDPDPLTAVQRVLSAASGRSDPRQLLKGIIMERLVDAVCPACSVPKPLPAAYRAYFSAAGLPVSHLAGVSPHGCRQCQRTGRFGRIPIFAVVPVYDRLRHALQGDEKQLCALFQKEAGLALLMFEGYQLSSQGKITLDDAEQAVAKF